MERLRFYLAHSLNDLRVNGQRTFFALLCIAAGVGAIVSLQTLSTMITDTLLGNLQESNRGDIQVFPQADFDEKQEILDQGMASGLVWQENEFSDTIFTTLGVETLVQWFADNYPGSTVTYRQAITDFNAAMSVSSITKDTEGNFVTPFFIEAGQYPVYGTVKSVEGEPLSELLREPRHIALSRNLADDLEAEVGDTIRIAGASEDFTVTGIVPTDSEAGLQNILAGMFGYYYVDVSAIQFFHDETPHTANTLYVRLEDTSKVDEASGRIGKEFPYLTKSSTTDLAESNKTFSDVIEKMVAVMGLVSLLIGGIGIVNTMLVIVSRRTTEVAVLKTLGLQPYEVTQLFLVEAILMGIVGSAAGVVLGWGMAFVVKGVAENFLSQSLSFHITATPAITGFLVGVIVTIIFGFLPTLAAGQIRPGNVLRPSEKILPQAGRLHSFIAIIMLLLVMSLVVQGMVSNLLPVEYKVFGGLAGAVYGILIATPLMVDAYRARYVKQIAGLLFVPVAGFAFGYFVPSILIVSGTMVVISYLYITLWFLIWAAGGGQMRGLWPGILILALPFFWPLIPVFALIVLPIWVTGKLIQWLAFIDLKIAMRSMLSNKGRGASTLVALAVGIFTLSAITMLVNSVTNAFGDLLEGGTGGNVLIFLNGSDEADVRRALDQQEGVTSYAFVSSYETQLVEFHDVSTDETLDFDGLMARVAGRRSDEGDYNDMLKNVLDGIDGREIGSNMPANTFDAGRELDVKLDNMPNENGIYPIIIKSDESVAAAKIGVDDLLTFAIGDNETVTFRVVGIIRYSEFDINVANEKMYTSRSALSRYKSTSTFVIADVDDAHIRDVRRNLSALPGTFVLETRLLNDIINRLIDQMSSFPILVAGLALFTSGIVIANSVALSTLERRREIAIVKAVGLQRKRVLGMLLMENGLMGLISGLIGVGISFVILLIILATLFEGELGNSIPYATAFGLMMLCLAISLGASLLSVWGASGEKPLNVLRYE
jgi:ABC-type antimicrobial peptide transport system permease subunit